MLDSPDKRESNSTGSDNLREANLQPAATAETEYKHQLFQCSHLSFVHYIARLQLLLHTPGRGWEVWTPNQVYCIWTQHLWRMLGILGRQDLLHQASRCATASPLFSTIQVTDLAHKAAAHLLVYASVCCIWKEPGSVIYLFISTNTPPACGWRRAAANQPQSCSSAGNLWS